MKTLLFAISVLFFLSACAGNNQQQHYYDMTWNCDGNVTCASHMGAWSGSGSFTNETDCLAWETAFLNSYGYPQDSVTACTYN